MLFYKTPYLSSVEQEVDPNDLEEVNKKLYLKDANKFNFNIYDSSFNSFSLR